MPPKTNQPEVKKYVKTSLSASYFEKNYQKFTQPSQTIPDQTLTMRQLLDRYAKGLPLDSKQEIYYGEDDNIPDFKKMDLTELAEYREQLNEDIKILDAREKKKQRRKQNKDIPLDNYDNKENENGAE